MRSGNTRHRNRNAIRGFEMSLPFSPLNVSNAGLGVKVTANSSPTSVPGSLVLTAQTPANIIRVFNNGTVLVFVRMSAEATPVATAKDVQLGPAQTIMMQNPVPSGTAGLAVLSSAATACDVYFSPGEGGY